MNKVVLSGRWTKDIDFKALDSGKMVAKSSIAVDEGYGDKKQTFFFEVEMWGKTAEAVTNYSGKGKKILLEGRLKVESWEKDGQKRYATKIVAEQVEFLEPKGDTGSQSQGNKSDPFANSKPIDISDDDLPF
jgi:single-strand DNA-binding protein